MPDTPLSSDPRLVIGIPPAYGGLTRSFAQFNLADIPANAVVSNANLRLYNTVFNSCVPRVFAAARVTSAWGPSSTWNTHPSATATDQGVLTESYCAGPAWTGPMNVTAIGQGWVNGSLPNHGLMVYADEADSGAYKEFSSAEGTNPPQLAITYNRPPPPPVPLDPSDAAVVSSPEPTLSVAPVSDPDGDPVRYWFSVATGPDPGGSGSRNLVTQSNWQNSASYKVPVGALQDGVTYYWRAYVQDQMGLYATGPVRRFKVDQRLGTSSSSPTDQLGPISVNLFNGNLALSASGPQLATTGGAVSQTLSYNSQSNAGHGLTGEYISDTNRNFALDEEPMAKRIDSAVTFLWETSSPYPGLPADNFGVRWSGFLTAPVAGTYFLGGWQNDRVRIWVDNTLVVDRWWDQAGGPNYGSAVSLNANQTVPIKVEYYDTSGDAAIGLYVKGAVVEQVVPSQWLTSAPAALPKGWSFSADLGAGLAYSSVRVSDSSLTLVGPDGASVEYRRVAGG